MTIRIACLLSSRLRAGQTSPQRTFIYECNFICWRRHGVFVLKNAKLGCCCCVLHVCSVAADALTSVPSPCCKYAGRNVGTERMAARRRKTIRCIVYQTVFFPVVSLRGFRTSMFTLLSWQHGVKFSSCHSIILLTTKPLQALSGAIREAVSPHICCADCQRTCDRHAVFITVLLL